MKSLGQLQPVGARLDGTLFVGEGQCYPGDGLLLPEKSPARSGRWGEVIELDACFLDGISAWIEAARKRRQRMAGFREDPFMCGEVCRGQAVAAFPRGKRKAEAKRLNFPGS